MTPGQLVAAVASIALAGALQVASPREPSGASLRSDSSSWTDATADDDSIFIWAGESESTSTGGSNEPITYVYKRIAQYYCGTLSPTTSDIPCVEGAETGRVIRMCPDGSVALDPLYRRRVDPDTGRYLGQWELVDPGGCPGDELVVVFTAEDFRRLPLDPLEPHFQPEHGRALVNLGIVVFTEREVQYFNTRVLGVAVQVRATPSAYTWDFGDGSQLVTSRAGSPYPGNTLRHPYADLGEYQVQLVTTWRGEYRVNGAESWLAVQGTARTVSAPFTVTVEEAPTALVAEPLG